MEDRRFRGVCEEYDLVWEAMSQDEHCAMFSFDDYCLLAASIEHDAITMAEADPNPGAIARPASPRGQRRRLPRPYSQDLAPQLVDDTRWQA